MQWRELILSDERKPKIVRHLAFWTAWWLYFFFCYYLLQQPMGVKMKSGYIRMESYLPIKTLLITLTYAAACYPVIYYILPQIFKRKFLIAAVSFILLSSVLFIASQILYWSVFPFIDSYFGAASVITKGAWFWPGVNMGLINFLKVVAAAAIIRSLKYWWLKHTESQLLEKEKINAELQLLKAQVHPDFLFNTLNNIYAHALSSSTETPGMLLKLSDLLSYMLYECDRPTVPLESEIAMMKEYMSLEKIRYKNELELQVTVTGDLKGKSIAPFLLLPFIENSFRQFGHVTEQSWINMDIRIEGTKFSMNLTNGISQNRIEQAAGETNGLVNVRKRLSLLYPGNYDLKMATEQEMFIVRLNIRLDDLMGRPDGNSFSAIPSIDELKPIAI